MKSTIGCMSVCVALLLSVSNTVNAANLGTETTYQARLDDADRSARLRHIRAELRLIDVICDANEYTCSDLEENGIVNLADFATFTLNSPDSRSWWGSDAKKIDISDPFRGPAAPITMGGADYGRRVIARCVLS